MLRNPILLPFLLLAGVPAALSAFEGTPPNEPPCEDGYRIVEEVCYREVVTRSYCRLVPDVKTVKKYEYTMKEVPFCDFKCPNPFRRRQRDACDACPECKDHPRCRRVLVKHEVIEKVPGFKCVVECETETVPYTTYRMVPIDSAAPRVPPAERQVP